ncbi:MAG TPA: hypothetical protein VKN18_14185 [Blastocatellia bacterium]|nr:hypothetical protein [Blastocatellia bacterium]
MRSIFRNWIATGLSFVIVLTVVLVPCSARAESGDHSSDRPIHLYATASGGPIGRIGSDPIRSSSLLINGQPSTAGQVVWSGDLLQSSPGAKACVPLDSIGQVRIGGGTTLRLATRPSSREDGTKGLTLVASLAQGEIAVELQPSANAYLRAARTEYESSSGASFKASVKNGIGSVEVKSGVVHPETQGAQHQYTIAPVGHDSHIKVRAGKLVRLQVQVREDDKPVPGVGVLFALDTSGAVIGVLGMGTLSGTTANVVTDADGMAAVQFVARDYSGTGPVSATVEGTRVAWTGEITVTSYGDHVKTSTWAWVILGGAAAAGGIAYAVTRDPDKPPLTAQPPMVKNP